MTTCKQSIHKNKNSTYYQNLIDGTFHNQAEGWSYFFLRDKMAVKGFKKVTASFKYSQTHGKDVDHIKIPHRDTHMVCYTRSFRMHTANSIFILRNIPRYVSVILWGLFWQEFWRFIISGKLAPWEYLKLLYRDLFRICTYYLASLAEIFIFLLLLFSNEVISWSSMLLVIQ